MKHTSILLSVSLVAMAGLALHMRSALSQDPGSLSVHFNSTQQTNMSYMVPAPEFLLVGDNVENYDIYKYQFSQSQLSDLQTYYDLYGIPIYELYKKWLENGGYIGSPLGRSKRELYRDCLQYSRYTYECQNGEQR